MNYRALLITLFLIMSVRSLCSDTEIYDYQEDEELIIKRNEEIEGKELESWSKRKISLNYRTDFVISNDSRLLFQAKNSNVETYFHKKEGEQLRVFAKYKIENKYLGVGYYRPVFGLGNIYKKSSTKDYLQRVMSKSNFDLQGLFGNYQIDSYKFNIFYSNNTLNTVIDCEGKQKIVYYESNKATLEQAGLIVSHISDAIEVSLLTSQFITNKRLEQFAYKKKFLLFANYIKFHKEKLELGYESNYEFSDLEHALWVRFQNDGFSSIWKYRSIPENSLNFFNSGISNKFNSNTEIYAGECSFVYQTYGLSIGSELKSNRKIDHWRSKAYLDFNSFNKINYRILQEIYRDYQAEKHEKYTHKVRVNLFDFSNSQLVFHYSLNNKKNYSYANMYQIEYNITTNYGKLKLNLKVLDNYKNEEIIQDMDENIIATFYDLSEDFLIFINYKSPEYKNFTLQGTLNQSMFNNKLNSFKIELSYLL